MRYAIVSDLHANFTAWQTVLKDIADLKVDKIICLGDVIGYGPEPVEVLESVYQHVHITLMGNHDAAVCGKFDPEEFSDRAQSAIERHKKALSPAARLWLRRLPYTYEEGGFACSHGDFSAPEEFRYIFEPESALPSWQVRREQLLFVGHSHLPGIYVVGESGTSHYLPPCDFILEEGKRYIVNPGSVGYPRAGDCRSSYCIYDTERGAVHFRQLPFDSEKYREIMTRYGWEDDDWVQKKAEQQQVKNIRKQLSFGEKIVPSPSQQEERRGRKFPPVLWFLLAGLLAVSVALAFALGKGNGRVVSYGLNLPPTELAVLKAYPLQPTDKNFLPPWPDSLEPDKSLRGWRYAMADSRVQRIGFGLDQNRTVLTLTHTLEQRILLISPMIDLTGPSIPALRMRVNARRGSGFKGRVTASVEMYMPDLGRGYVLFKTEPFQLYGRETEQGLDVNRKIQLPKKAARIRFCIDATFTGTLDIHRPYLGQEVKKEK